MPKHKHSLSDKSRTSQTCISSSKFHIFDYSNFKCISIVPCENFIFCLHVSKMLYLLFSSYIFVFSISSFYSSNWDDSLSFLYMYTFASTASRVILSQIDLIFNLILSISRKQLTISLLVNKIYQKKKPPWIINCYNTDKNINTSFLFLCGIYKHFPAEIQLYIYFPLFLAAL